MLYAVLVTYILFKTFKGYIASDPSSIIFFVCKVKREDAQESSGHYESEGMENYEGFIENYGKYFIEPIK